jgi:hypothetical protein
MRLAVLLPLALCAAACGESGERHTYLVPMEGQSSAELQPPEPPKPAPEPPPPNSPMRDSPSWLRSNAPLQWTVPDGWTAEMSTRPNRLVEFTIEKNGPGNSPIQFLILNGADEHPNAKQASFQRWEQFYREDRAPVLTTRQHDGVEETRYVVHGRYEGQNALGTGEQIAEDNWTMVAGWVVGPQGSIMFKFQGPDAIVLANMPKVDALLGSMKPREEKQ